MSDLWAAVSAISGVVALLVVGAATVYAYRQFREAARARTASVLLQFQLWHTSEPVKSCRRRLLAGEFADVTRLSGVERAQLEDVIDQMEFLSMLVEHRLIDAPVAKTFYRYSPQRVWEHAEPFILEMRQLAPGYGQHLERFAKTRLVAF